MAETDLGLADLRYAFWGGPSNERGLLQDWINNNFTADDLVFKDPSTGELVDSSGAGMDTYLVQSEENELASTTASVTFSSISQTGRLLVVRWSARSTRGAANDTIQCAINGSADADHKMQYTRAAGSTVSAGSIDGSGGARGVGLVPAASGTANVFGVGEGTIVDYADTSKQPALIGNAFEPDGPSSERRAVILKSAGAVTSLTFSLLFGSFAAGSYFKVDVLA